MKKYVFLMILFMFVCSYASKDRRSMAVWDHNVALLGTWDNARLKTYGITFKMTFLPDGQCYIGYERDGEVYKILPGNWVNWRRGTDIDTLYMCFYELDTITYKRKSSVYIGTYKRQDDFLQLDVVKIKSGNTPDFRVDFFLKKHVEKKKRRRIRVFNRYLVGNYEK